MGLRSAFSKVVLTGGVMSPLAVYPKLLEHATDMYFDEDQHQAALPLTARRQFICPVIVSRGGDQSHINSKFELRKNRTTANNYGAHA